MYFHRTTKSLTERATLRNLMCIVHVFALTIDCVCKF